MTVRTRFAPSPTGFLHVGGARTALFCWLHARHHGGEFVLRIEDTDRERSTQASVDAILDSMRWLGLEWDEGPFYQTERMDLYKQYIDRLLEEDKAYHCYCSKDELEAMRERQRAEGLKPRYDGRCRNRTSAPPVGIDPVVRFKNPLEGDVVVEDQVYGTLTFANSELDDLVIARPDGTPTYNFTVVVDDYEMRITHVIRGDDHVNNTPRQLNILRALGADEPTYAHVPMILGADGQRLSKRHGAVSVLQFKDEGFLSDALLNYLVRLGWSHGDQEVFSRDEMVSLFALSAVNRSASVFDNEKLLWLNQQYIKDAANERLTQELAQLLDVADAELSEGPPLSEVVEVQRDRAKTLIEMAEKSAFAYGAIEFIDEKAAAKHLKAAAVEPLTRMRERLVETETWQVEPLHQAVVDTADACGIKLGKLAQPLRVALTGTAMSPSIDQTLYLVGRERSLARIDAALEHIQQNNGGCS